MISALALYNAVETVKFVLDLKLFQCRQLKERWTSAYGCCKLKHYGSKCSLYEPKSKVRRYMVDCLAEQ
jgi:hypothetical protein